MPDARHPKQYPKGSKYPKMQLTPAWKAKVRQVLEDNAKNGRQPANPAELARMVGASKTGLLKMLNTDQPTYKYTKQICDVLRIDLPMIANPSIPEIEDDEWDRTVAAAKRLPIDEQRRFLRTLKALVEEPH
jgi:hypothetical protein